MIKWVLRASALLSMTCVVNAQMFTASPLPFSSSAVLAELKAIKAADSKITPAQFSEKANAALARLGINYEFTLAASICAQAAAVRAKKKDPTAPVTATLTSRSVGGDMARLQVPNVITSSEPCGRCFFSLPLAELKGDTMVTKVLGQNIMLQTISEAKTVEASLVGKDGSATRTWRLPFFPSRVFLSDDSEVLYLEMPDVDLKDVFLGLFSTGEMIFADPGDVNPSGVRAVSQSSKPVDIQLDAAGAKDARLLRVTPACN